MDAEERGQAEAIARSTDACLSLGVPNIAVIIGEGGSGGAVAIATANKVLMLEHAIYTVASPEASASILWRDSSRAQDAATSMKITAQDLIKFGIVDGDRVGAGRRRAPRPRRRDRLDGTGDLGGAAVAARHEPGRSAQRTRGKIPRNGPQDLRRRGRRRKPMLQTWRWFGPDDPVSLPNIAQAGAAGVVTALHHRNRGEVWSIEEVAKRRAEIERAGLAWPVVESIGVGEEIKTRTGAFRQKIDNYKQSLRNAARAGVKVFCYNFMAITDWTRTDLKWPLAQRRHRAALRRGRFRRLRLFMLEREGAEGDYAPERVAAAHGALRRHGAAQADLSAR